MAMALGAYAHAAIRTFLVGVQARSWTFRTPKGWTIVRAKEVDPLWVPPDWRYVELPRKLGLGLQQLAYGDSVRLRDGSLLMARGSAIGVVGTDSVFRCLPEDEEVIFDGKLFAPPFGTNNRRVKGILGPYRLLLANGAGLHGTPYPESIGQAVTHGCIRLFDDDITWLYVHIPVGTRVRIY